eukprot:m.62147 g.62147  ORF g.62147 m.62147 type:complete len:213 (-) comp11894_c0_seq4:350-988(-)
MLVNESVSSCPCIFSVCLWVSRNTVISRVILLLFPGKAVNVLLASQTSIHRTSPYLCRQVFSLFEKEVLPVLSSLPRGVIQNDCNDHNVIVSESGSQVHAIIDFGDMVHSCRVFDLAICLAYALLDTDASVVESSRKLCLGYCDTIPINGTERAILYTSVMARLCQSVVMSSYSYSKDPGNEYLLVTAEPGWRLLSTMLAMSDEDKKAINGQ